MMDFKNYDWHPMAEQPDFGRGGDKMRNLLLRNDKGYVAPVTMNLERWQHVGEEHMYPKAVKWAYEEQKQEGAK